MDFLSGRGALFLMLLAISTLRHKGIGRRLVTGALMRPIPGLPTGTAAGID